MMLFGMQSRTTVLSLGFCPILPWNAYGLGAIPIEYGRILWLNLCGLNVLFVHLSLRHGVHIIITTAEITTELNGDKGI
jgi:hypothetical protein